MLSPSTSSGLFLIFHFFPTMLRRTGGVTARAEFTTIVWEPEHLLLHLVLLHLHASDYASSCTHLYPLASPLYPPTCMLCTNWMAEQSPSFCISQFGKGSTFKLLLPFLGTFGIFAKLRGWWLPCHLQTELEKVAFFDENPERPWFSKQCWQKSSKFVKPLGKLNWKLC